MSFVFYDTETTGVDTFFDQILQFAAIKTDENLNEIDRIETRCRLKPHSIMSPGAMLVTGVTWEQAADPDLPSHYQMIQQIREKLLDWSPAIFVGYNSMAFDEELLRQALYQSLRNPYLTQLDGNARSDAMILTKAVSEFSPNCLEIPLNDRGRKVFKLDRVAPANGFDHSNAHDAMADVEALIFLSKIMIEGAEDEWSNFTRFSQKAAVEAFISEDEPFLVTEFFTFGGHKHFPVVQLGTDQDHSAKHLCYDLMNDPSDFKAMSDDALGKCFSNKPKPLRKIKSNAAPALRAIDGVPPSLIGDMTEQDISERADEVLNDEEFTSRLLQSYEQNKTVYDPAENVEQKIYDGFPSNQDQINMDQFHEVPWPERHKKLSEFEDDRWKKLAARIIYDHNPDFLPVEHQEAVRSEIRDRLLCAEECKWTTIPVALAECDELGSTADGDQAKMLEDLKLQLGQLAESLS